MLVGGMVAGTVVGLPLAAVVEQLIFDAVLSHLLTVWLFLVEVVVLVVTATTVTAKVVDLLGSVLCMEGMEEHQTQLGHSLLVMVKVERNLREEPPGKK